LEAAVPRDGKHCCAVGNHAHLRRSSPVVPRVQSKLTIGEADDPL